MTANPEAAGGISGHVADHHGAGGGCGTRRPRPAWAAACLIAGTAVGLSACVADGGAGLAGPALGMAPGQAGYATYDCGDEGSITVEAMASAVRLVDEQGASYDLPASPPAQASRFGEGNVALVVEGGEALWMKAGREPMTCR